MIPLPPLPDDDDQAIDLLKTRLDIVDRMLAMIAAFEERDVANTPLWVQVWRIETARRFANVLLEPPLLDEEIKWYARRFNMSEREAQADLRRQRNDS